jgi:hypothetical protein
LLTISGPIRALGLAALVGIVFMALMARVAQPCFAADSFAVYQVGVKEQQSWSLARDFFKEKGYDALFQLGEMTIEKHLERMGRINRSPAKFLLALEFVSGDPTGVLVAMTDQKAIEGGPPAEPGKPSASGTGNGPTTFAADAQAGNRFLAVDALPGKYAAYSGKLADEVAGSFKTKVKHLPLFPLLGADMPGILLRIECSRDKVGEMLGLLHGSIQKYLRRDVSHER